MDFNKFTDKEKNKAGRVAGIMLLCSLLVPALNWAFILSKFVMPENVISTAQNILSEKMLFRINIINELISGVVIVLLAISLYLILKSINKHLGLIALILKLVGAFLTFVIAFMHLIVLQVLSNLSFFTAANQEQVKALIGVFLNNHILLTSIPGMFLGLSMSIFLYLLLKSKYIPNILASFGLVSYVLIFIYDLLFFFSPTYSSIPIIQIIGWGPNVLFVLITGIWLMIKGLNIQKI
ncbi:DUF4386 domain-containing protein [Candidatus Neomarinimicrobiota bacterium]